MLEVEASIVVTVKGQADVYLFDNVDVEANEVVTI